MRMALLPQMMRSARLLECSALDLATQGLGGRKSRPSACWARVMHDQRWMGHLTDRLKPHFLHHLRLSCAVFALLFSAASALASANFENRAAQTIIDRPEAAHGPLPTIIVLHGAGLSGALTRNMMPLPKLAKEAGFVVAFPDAAGLVWNEASLALALPSAFYGPDDVALLDGLIDHLVQGGIADPAAIHLVGISNGGMMAAHYACLRAGRLASLMLFKATMPPASDPPCTPARPLPVMLVAGTQDPVVRWDGNVVLGGAVMLQRRRSIPESFAFWQAANGCTGVAPAEPQPRRGALDQPDVLLHRAEPCRHGVATWLYEVRGGGHRLPGGEELSLLRVLGRATPDLETSAMILAFARSAKAVP